MASKAPPLPGVSDIHLLNRVLAVALWFGSAGWLLLLYLLIPLVEVHPGCPVEAFWLTLSAYRGLAPLVALAVLGLLGWVLRLYLKHASLHAGWLLPLAVVGGNVGALAGFLYLVGPVLLQ